MDQILEETLAPKEAKLAEKDRAIAEVTAEYVQPEIGWELLVHRSSKTP